MHLSFRLQLPICQEEYIKSLKMVILAKLKVFGRIAGYASLIWMHDGLRKIIKDFSDLNFIL